MNYSVDEMSFLLRSTIYNYIEILFLSEMVMACKLLYIYNSKPKVWWVYLFNHNCITHTDRLINTVINNQEKQTQYVRKKKKGKEIVGLLQPEMFIIKTYFLHGF